MLCEFQISRGSRVFPHREKRQAFWYHLAPSGSYQDVLSFSGLRFVCISLSIRRWRNWGPRRWGGPSESSWWAGFQCLASKPARGCFAYKWPSVTLSLGYTLTSRAPLHAKHVCTNEISSFLGQNTGYLRRMKKEKKKKQLLPLESETPSEAISQWNSRNSGIITIAFDISCQSTKKKKKKWILYILAGFSSIPFRDLILPLLEMFLL